MATKEIRLTILLSDERIEQAKRVAAEQSAKFPQRDPWTWRQWLEITAQVAIIDRLDKEIEKATAH